MQFTELDVTILDLSSTGHSAEDTATKLNEKLELAVGETIFSKLTKDQINAYLTILESAPQEVNGWLRKNIPNYLEIAETCRKQIVIDINNVPENSEKVKWVYSAS